MYGLKVQSCCMHDQVQDTADVYTDSWGLQDVIDHNSSVAVVTTVICGEMILGPGCHIENVCHWEMKHVHIKKIAVKCFSYPHSSWD